MRGLPFTSAAFIEGFKVTIVLGSIAAILLVLWLWREYSVLRRLDNKGVLTDAQIMKLKLFPTRPTTRRLTSYFVEYQFRTDKSDEVHIREQIISGETYYILKNQDTVKVRYLPENPSISRLADQHRDNYTYMYLVGMIFGMILGLIGIVLGLFIFFRRSIF
ncbi:MAG: DUF3592 domain-containing protein [Anaerolineae bacterium]|nr:DUF3592 domain-containing protein [Anaerolineae bacterium]